MRLSLKITLCALIAATGLTLFSNPSFAASLKLGTSGSSVSKLQQTLKNKGYYSYEVTGYYGSITKTAVKNFQKANDLIIDGIAGSNTLNKLYSANTSLMKVGSTGQNVSKLQSTLKSLGYFNYSITGYYGSITKTAVKNFQKANNLIIDGIAGSNTLNKLYSTNNFSNVSDDIYWLSRIIHAESEGEPYTGKIAVGNVVMNRVKSKNYPNDIKSVIFQYVNGIPMFSPVANGKIYTNPSEDSIKAAYEAYNGTRPVGNATYFFNPTIASSSWISRTRQFIKRIGEHAFYS